MKKLVAWIDKTLKFLLAVAMSSILLAVIWQVISRYLMDDPASFTEEFARFLLIWIGILGAALAYRERAHLGINLLVERAGSYQKILLTIIEVIVFLFCLLVLVNGGALLVNLTLELEQISASLGVKIGYVYSVLPLSGLLIMFYCVVNIHNLWQPDEARKW